MCIIRLLPKFVIQWTTFLVASDVHVGQSLSPYIDTKICATNVQKKSISFPFDQLEIVKSHKQKAFSHCLAPFRRHALAQIRETTVTREADKWKMGALAERRRIRHGFWLRCALAAAPRNSVNFSRLSISLFIVSTRLPPNAAAAPRAPPPPIVRGHQIVTKPSNVLCAPSLAAPSKSLFCRARIYTKCKLPGSAALAMQPRRRRLHRDAIQFSSCH